MLNRVTLIGRITKDIEIKKSSGGIPFTFFTLAVNNFSNKNQNADFITCIAWDKVASNMQSFLKRGSLIAVDGRIQTRSVEQNAMKTVILEVRADRVVFLEKKSDSKTNFNDNFQKTSDEAFSIEGLNFESLGISSDVVDNEQMKNIEVESKFDDGSIKWE